MLRGCRIIRISVAPSPLVRSLDDMDPEQLILTTAPLCCVARNLTDIITLVKCNLLVESLRELRFELPISSQIFQTCAKSREIGIAMQARDAGYKKNTIEEVESPVHTNARHYTKCGQRR